MAPILLKVNVFTSFLGLDVGNENHIGVLVIILCHNSPYNVR